MQMSNYTKYSCFFTAFVSFKHKNTTFGSIKPITFAHSQKKKL